MTPPRTPAPLATRNAVAAAIMGALASRDGVTVLRELGAAATSGSAEAARAAVGLAAAERYWRGGGPPAAPLERALVQAAALFDAGLYFEVHEVLEEAWHGLEGDVRRFVQGLIQVAVGLHHLVHGNPAGARTLLGEGRAKLAPHVPVYRGVAVAALLAGLRPFERAAAAGAAWPERAAAPALDVTAVVERTL
jgi:hypothetical protein